MPIHRKKTDTGGRRLAMRRRNRLYVTISLIYAMIGGLVGIIRLADPELIPGNVLLIHAHIMLLGFVLMMIYGVGLHVIPRFSGYPLRSERLADIQFWCANIGLPLMVAGWLSLTRWVVAVGGVLSAAAIALFAFNMVFTVRLRNPLDAK
jgi:cbb3-type cytochrome oxidase subunit 1